MSSEPVRYGWSSPTPPHTHDYLAPIVLRHCRQLQAQRVLDLGCGNGALSQVLAEAGMEVTGCDADPVGIELARQTVPTGRFESMQMSDDPSRLGDCEFDVVVSTEVVEHLLYPRELPRFARRVLKPGGHLIITTPYHGYWKNLLMGILGKWDQHHSPLWDGGHVKFWSRATLRKLLEDEGFETLAFEGIGRAPGLWKSMLFVARVHDSKRL